MKHLGNIIELEGKTINALFKDSCSLENKIISTSHVNDGGNVVGQVKNWIVVMKIIIPPLVGDYINFKVDEIESYKLMKKR